MKRFIAFICVLCVASMLLPVFAIAAENEPATPYGSSFFSAFETYIYRIDGNKIGVWFYVLAKRYMDVLGVESIRLESSGDLTNWTTIKTFSPENYSQMQTTEAFVYENGVSHTATYGRYYRAQVRFYAKDGVSKGYYTVQTATFYV